MSPPKHTKFCGNWLELGWWWISKQVSPRWKKVTEVLNVNYACKLCYSYGTLTSHLKSKKHVSRAQNKDSQGVSLKTWIQSSFKSTCSSDSTNITSKLKHRRKKEFIWNIVFLKVREFIWNIVFLKVREFIWNIVFLKVREFIWNIVFLKVREFIWNIVFLKVREFIWNIVFLKVREFIWNIVFLKVREFIWNSYCVFKGLREFAHVWSGNSIYKFLHEPWFKLSHLEL